MGYLDGFGVTIKKLLGPGTGSGERVTTQYPEQTRPKPERFHGRHVLNRYDDGMEKCIGCELCAGVCPAQCIYVRGADNDPDDPTSPGERFGFIYEINYLRCIHCDLCVEACPTEAITETKLFEFAFTNRADAIYTKDELVVDDEGRPQQLPWENWDGGFDPAADTSGWMRATSPSGDADFAGIVAWAGELGYGVRAPEGGGTVTTEPIAELAEPVLDEPAVESPPEDEPVAMAAGTEQAVTFDAVDEVDAAPSEPAAAGDDARPLFIDAGPEDPGSSDVDAADRSATDADLAAEDPATEATSQPSSPTRPAGLFDAPDADAGRARSSKDRRPFGRRRTRRDQAPSAGPSPAPEEEDLLRPRAQTSSTDDTTAEDAAVVASLEETFDSAPEPAEAADAPEDAPEEAPEPDASDGDDDVAPDAPITPPPERPTAGFFDAPDEPEPPKGRKGRRRRGGR